MSIDFNGYDFKVALNKLPVNLLEEAVNLSPDLLQYVYNENRTNKMYSFLLDDIMAYTRLDNPTEEESKLVVGYDGMMLEYVKNPSEDVIMIALKENGKAIKFVENPNEEMCKLAVTTSGYALKNIKIHTKELCSLAVKNFPYALEFCKAYPSDEDIINAIKKDPSLISCIQTADLRQRIRNSLNNENSLNNKDTSYNKDTHYKTATLGISKSRTKQSSAEQSNSNIELFSNKQNNNNNISFGIKNPNDKPKRGLLKSLSF